MSGYRPVRVAGDELIHYADAQATHTLGCQQQIATKLPSNEEGDAAGRRCSC